MAATAGGSGATRRDFLYLGTAAVGAAGGVMAAVPFVKQMWPDASILAASSTEVDLKPIAEGQAVTVKWRGKPVFIRHRTAKEIEEAKATKLADLKDPSPDTQRVRSFDKKPQEQWIIVLGVCTHLGCVPIKNSGDFLGWYCPCHGSHYDNAGRIRKGPAPSNLPLPPFEFLSADKIKIG